MSDRAAIVSSIKLVFADGTPVWATGRKAADHVFHPVVLKNTFICLLVFALMQGRPDIARLDGWQIALLWLSVAAATLMWFYLAVQIAIFLAGKRLIGFVYTPFITIPLMLVNQFVIALVLASAGDDPQAGAGLHLPFLVRDILVALLFDTQFGSYVAPRHPLYHLSEPQPRTAPADPAARMRPEPPAPAASPRPTPHEPGQDPRPLPARPEPSAPPPLLTEDLPDPDLRPITSGYLSVGGEEIRIADLVSMHAEDHYVRLHMKDRNLLLRGRFTELAEKLGPAHGRQISRSDWINRAHIRTVQRTSDYRLVVTMADGQTLPVARARKVELTGYLRDLGVTVQRQR